jgi:hypothetical protein
MADQADVDIQPTAPEPARRLGGRVRRWAALALVVVLGCWAGGWFRAWSDSGLTAAQADQTNVRLTLDSVPLSQANGCDELGSNVAMIQIPLHNYSPGPVVIRSVAVDPPGQPPEPTQATGVSIPADGSGVVQILIPMQLCTATHTTHCPNTGVELDATAAVVPESGQVHELRLPIGEWVPTKFLQLYEEAPFAGWGSSFSCP